MKKLTVILASLFMAGAMFADPVTSTSGNNLSAFGNVTVSVDKDYSKKKPAELKKATVEETVYLDEKCVKATKNSKGEIRLAFMFDEPVPATDLKFIKYSIAGFDGYSGHYNIGVMYEEMGANNEHSMSCYTSSSVKKDEWTTWTFDLKWDEVWNKNFDPKKKVIGIQLWTNATKEAYIKDVELMK